GGITQTDSGRIVGAALLSATSAGGQSLIGENAVRSLFATNFGGDVRLNNTVNLEILGIAQTVGDIEVANAGSLTVSGAIKTKADSNITLSGETLNVNAAITTGRGTISILTTGDVILGDVVATSGNVDVSAGGRIAQVGTGRFDGVALLSTASVGGQELTGENDVRALHASNIGGDVRFTNTVNLDILGIAQTVGDIEVANEGALTVSGAIEASADGNITLDADRLVQNAAIVSE